MKRLGQGLMGVVFAALLMLSCRTLVERPETGDEAPPPLPMPVQAVLRSASEAFPEEDLTDCRLPEMASRRLLPGPSATALVPAGAPVRDGNGMPLGDKPYVRTVYAACRLEETSG